MFTRDGNFLLSGYALSDCYIAIIWLIFLFAEMANDEHRVSSLSFFLVNYSVELPVHGQIVCQYHK